MKDLLNLTYKELNAVILEIGEKSYRTTQIFEWIYKKRVYDISLMTNISQKTRELLSKEFSIYIPQIAEKVESKDDSTIKYVLTLKDENLIECVLMKYSYGYGLCVSSQVGCRMGCGFCASTGLGLVRNLWPGEFTGQILAVEKHEGIKVSNIVIMGIGEPLDNYENLMDFIDITNDENGMNIGIRNFTVSTCGIADKIYKLADRGSQINLALSLHSVDDIKRASIMPIAKKYKVDDLIKAMKYYNEKTGRRPSYEYIMIQGFNDSTDEAKQLAEKIAGTIAHVNIIALNKIKEGKFNKAERQNIDAFTKVLNNNGIEVTIRRRLGNDINAACGQLRRSRSK